MGSGSNISAAIAVALAVLAAYLYFYQHDSVSWMWGGDDPASSGSNSVGVSFTESGTTLETFANRENFRTAREPGGGGLCEMTTDSLGATVPPELDSEHELCDERGVGIRYMVYFGSTDMSGESREKPAVVQEKITDGAITDLVYVTHYDDQTKVNKSAVADMVTLCKTIVANTSDEVKKDLTEELVIQGDEIVMKKDRATGTIGSGYVGTGEPSMCSDGENFCLPLIPGVNYPVLFSIMMAVIMAEIDGKSVDPDRVKFNILIPGLETYNLERVVDGYDDIWADYQV